MAAGGGCPAEEVLRMAETQGSPEEKSPPTTGGQSVPGTETWISSLMLSPRETEKLLICQVGDLVDQELLGLPGRGHERGDPRLGSWYGLTARRRRGLLLRGALRLGHPQHLLRGATATGSHDSARGGCSLRGTAPPVPFPLRGNHRRGSLTSGGSRVRGARDSGSRSLAPSVAGFRCCRVAHHLIEGPEQVDEATPADGDLGGGQLVEQAVDRDRGG